MSGGDDAVAVSLPAPVTERLARLAPDQRAAATAPPGPVLCVAPAGSGKTTTLVARVAWLVGDGTAADSICALTFNKRAAEELSDRLDAALAPLGILAGAVRVRTFHALGREILRDAGRAVEPLADRDATIRRIAPEMDAAGRRRLDTAFSRLKLDLAADLDAVAADEEAGPIARAWVAYERALAADGALDFDDLVARALRLLETDAVTLARWRAACANLLVDEAQDLDRSQVRLALLLAAPANRIFLVGDDDQSIYGWRLADVRRILGLAESLPGLRRIDLETNYRCPAPVVERAVRLIEGNRERFRKRIRARSEAPGVVLLAADAADDDVRLRRIVERWPPDDSTRAVLARTNRELLAAVSVALDLNLAFRAPAVPLVLDSPVVDELLERVRELDDRAPLLVRIGRVRDALPAATDVEDEEPAVDAVAAALLAWAARVPDLDALLAMVAERRALLLELRRDDAPLTLATAHATKGLEFDHVAVVGMERGRFPSERSVTESAEPDRALEEERRLAYVAWTRARRTLTLSYDPAIPSPFLLEAFTVEELGLGAA